MKIIIITCNCQFFSLIYTNKTLTSSSQEKDMTDNYKRKNVQACYLIAGFSMFMTQVTFGHKAQENLLDNKNG